MGALTPKQASCVATIRAYGHIKSPVDAWMGWMRFYEADGVPPQVIETAPRGTDTMAVRLQRLKEKGLYLHAASFTALRRPLAEASSLAPVDVVGFNPEDFAGQCALLYQLMRYNVPLATLAYAFSVPYTELGERLLIGEQLELCNDEVDVAARRAIREVR